eukprot:413068-Pelagomonas_calceolata.AAC.2
MWACAREEGQGTQGKGMHCCACVWCATKEGLCLQVQVYYYFRSLGVSCPFVTARENLLLLFERNRARGMRKGCEGQRLVSASVCMSVLGVCGDPFLKIACCVRRLSRGCACFTQQGLLLAKRGQREEEAGVSEQLRLSWQWSSDEHLCVANLLHSLVLRGSLMLCSLCFCAARSKASIEHNTHVLHEVMVLTTLHGPRQPRQSFILHPLSCVSSSDTSACLAYLQL